MSTISLNNFWSRTITGAIFVIAIVGSIIVSPVVFAALFLMATLLTLNEFYSLVNQSTSIKVHKITGLLVVSVLYSTIVLAGLELISKQLLWINLLLPVLVFTAELYRKTKTPIHNIGLTNLGVIYVGLPFALLNLLYYPPVAGMAFTPSLLLGFFILTWSNDTFAYLSGVALGRHKLFPAISPKKTWEGAIGGFILTLGAAWILSLFYTETVLLNWLAMAGIIVIFGNFGDLAESMMKRSLNIKDSGKILPGHGGMLDRFDAALFASPAVFVYINMI